MALPTFPSIAFQLDTSAASINVDVSSLGLVEGDALIALTAEDTNPDGHTVSGNNSGAYALLHESSSSSPSSTVAWKVQGATPDTLVNVDLINIRATGTTGLIVKIPGVNVANPIDAPLVNLQGTAGMPNPPAVATVTANAVRIITGHLDDDQTPVIAPSGFEQVIYNAQTNAVGGHTTVMIAFREETTPGMLDPGPFVATGDGDDEWWATHFAVNLAAAPADDTSASPGAGAASTAGAAPGAAAGASSAPGAGAASTAGQAPVIAASTSSRSELGVATGDGLAVGASVASGSNTLPGAGSSNSLGFDPIVGASVHIEGLSGVADGTGQSAGVSFGAGAEIGVAPGGASGTGSQAASSTSSELAPAAGLASGAGLVAIVSREQGALVAPVAGAGLGRGYAPGVLQPVPPTNGVMPPDSRVFTVRQQIRIFRAPAQNRRVRA